MDDHHTLLTRRRETSSFRKFVYASLRRPTHKKPKVAAIIESIQETPIFQVESIDNHLEIIRRSVRDDYIRKIFSPLRNIVPTECSVVKHFPKDGKPYDPSCKLTSFERKWRAHQEFGAANHSNVQLFCPEQASQIELQFKLQVHKEVLLRVTAPNGEVSGVLHPTRTEPVTFNPSKVGCGHGKWTIEIVTREGIRFRMCHREEIFLSGQGCLTYEIDHQFRLKLVEQLWLNFY